MNKLIRQLNRDILQALAARRPGGVLTSRKVLQRLMNAPAWDEGMSALFPIRGRLSCARILELCAPILNTLCPVPPKEGWGKFTYQYVCRLMFPEGGFAPEAERCGEVLGLTATEVHKIKNFERGYGLLSCNGNNIAVRFQASAMELSLITTDPEELQKLVEGENRGTAEKTGP